MNCSSKSQLTALVCQLLHNYGIRQLSSPSMNYTLNFTSKSLSGRTSCYFHRTFISLVGKTKTKRPIPPANILNQNVNSYHSLLGCCQQSFVLKESNFLKIVRQKSKKKQTQTEDSDDDDSDLEDAFDEDDYDAPAHFKVQKIHSASLRIDAVLSKSLGISRNHLEDTFFGTGFYLNGEKVLKKGAKMEEGDYVDYVLEKFDDQLKVKRVKLLKIGKEITKKENIPLKVRVWKAAFLIANPNSQKHS